MDPIRVPENPDPLPRGESVFIPFEGFNPRVENGQGKADFNLAIDLPPKSTIHEAKTYVMNNRALASRVIEYREYSIEEIQNDPAVYGYLTVWEGR